MSTTQLFNKLDSLSCNSLP